MQLSTIIIVFVFILMILVNSGVTQTSSKGSKPSYPKTSELIQGKTLGPEKLISSPMNLRLSKMFIYKGKFTNLPPIEAVDKNSNNQSKPIRYTGTLKKESKSKEIKPPSQNRQPKDEVLGKKLPTEIYASGLSCKVLNFDDEFGTVRKYNGGCKDNFAEGFGKAYGDKGIRYEGYFTKGKPQGPGYTSFKVGKIISTFSDGRLNGPAIFFYRSGDKLMGDYFRNKEHGEWLHLDRSGKNGLLITFHHGRIISKQKLLHEDDKKKKFMASYEKNNKQMLKALLANKAFRSPVEGLSVFSNDEPESKFQSYFVRYTINATKKLQSSFELLFCPNETRGSECITESINLQRNNGSRGNFGSIDLPEGKWNVYFKYKNGKQEKTGHIITGPDGDKWFKYP
jgi:hypothetical protein